MVKIVNAVRLQSRALRTTDGGLWALRVPVCPQHHPFSLLFPLAWLLPLLLPGCLPTAFDSF